jgi:hypothetical protein
MLVCDAHAEFQLVPSRLLRCCGKREKTEIHQALVSTGAGHAQWKTELAWFDAMIEQLAQAQGQARN